MQKLESVAVDNLLTLARALAQARRRRRHKCSLRTVSRACHGDASALPNLARGAGSITLRKYDEAMGWLLDPKNWPEGAAIPRVREPWSSICGAAPTKTV